MGGKIDEPANDGLPGEGAHTGPPLNATETKTIRIGLVLPEGLDDAKSVQTAANRLNILAAELNKEGKQLESRKIQIEVGIPMVGGKPMVV